MAKGKKPVVFYAYPSRPEHIGETITEAGKAFKTTGDIDFKTWVDMEIAGLRITRQILKKIDQCDVFACDLTYLNNNVLFELGYAIAKRKKIFPTLNTTILDADKRYQTLEILANIGYTPYSNSHELFNRMSSSGIFRPNYKSLAADSNLFSLTEPFGILYLKSKANSDASRQVTETISDYPFTVIMDDPTESPNDSLDWHTRHIASCGVVLAHFMSTEQVGHEYHNLKISFVCGMAFGYEKPTFFLAPQPFQCPSDIPNFLKDYTTAAHAKGLTRTWLSKMLDEQREIEKQRREYKSIQRQNKNLKTINIGQFLAENEYEDLHKYFVETGAYNEIINGRQTIFIGRKGSGKTANLYSAEEHFRSDRRNLVIVIKPAGYEMSTLIKILNQAKEVEERGFFAESLWRYLLYTEIARAIDEKFKTQVGKSANIYEQDLLKYSSDNSDFLSESFSSRLRTTIEAIDIANYDSNGHQSILEYLGVRLHSQLIRNLKKKLAPILQNYRNVVILIDNLDKGWDRGVDIEKVADILFSLLSVSRQIPEEIKQDTNSGSGVNLRMTVFLRTDIFSYILESAREKDKLEVYHIEWGDKEILAQVLDQRLVSEFPDKVPQELWNQFFVNNINGLSPREFIINNIRLRPRDAIVFMKEIISSAISRGHSRVEETDLENGSSAYSKWVYKSLIDEDDPSKNLMKNVLKAFIGEEKEYNEGQVLKIIKDICLDDVTTENYLNLLFDSHFFEIEYNPGSYKVVDDPDDREILLTAVRKRAEKRGEQMKIRINNAFHKSLYLD